MAEPIRNAEIDIVFDFDHVERVGEQFIADVLRAKAEEAKVLVLKQAAYGPDNIGKPPHGISPEVALTVRINDKVQRLSTLLTAGDSQPAGSEARTDTWGDIANYGTIGTLVEAGLWPGLRTDDRQLALDVEKGQPEEDPAPEEEGHPLWEGTHPARYTYPARDRSAHPGIPTAVVPNVWPGSYEWGKRGNADIPRNYTGSHEWGKRALRAKDVTDRARY